MSCSEEFILWGSAGHAMVLAELVQSRGGRILALFDNNPKAESSLEGVPLFTGEKGFLEWSEQHQGSKPAGGVAIGGHKGADRLAILKMFKAQGVVTPQFIHHQSSVSRNSSIGSGSHILAMSVVAAGVRIGEGAIINHGSVVDHESVIGDGCHIAPGAVLCGCVCLEENVFIGAGCTILPRIKIGKNSIIGAGSTVTKDIPPNSVAYGSPATIHRSSI